MVLAMYTLCRSVKDEHVGTMLFSGDGLGTLSLPEEDTNDVMDCCQSHDVMDAACRSCNPFSTMYMYQLLRTDKMPAANG